MPSIKKIYNSKQEERDAEYFKRGWRSGYDQAMRDIRVALGIEGYLEGRMDSHLENYHNED